MQASLSEPLFQAFNKHSPQCADPPIVVSSEGTYTGYFENGIGQQWLFSFDRKTKRGTLRGGDLGWNHAAEVIDGAAVGVLLGPDEAYWLAACWAAATDEDPRRPQF
jgi:hypothetical protein